MAAAAMGRAEELRGHAGADEDDDINNHDRYRLNTAKGTTRTVSRTHASHARALRSDSDVPES